MNVDTTNSSRPEMNCARVAREEILEGYLVGRLTDEDREAFEEHYFECTRCFDELKTLQAIREELLRVGVESETTTTRPLLRWAPAAAIAASVVLVVSVALWMRPTLQSNSPLATRVPAPSPAQVPEKPRREPPPSLEQLARVDPPRYEPVTLRNVPDEATKRFQRGMEQYRQADYAGAVEHLRAAMSLDPRAPHIYFFLGISELMLGKDKDAIVQLSRTIALGDSAYLEEAHWYLAKAFLRQKDLDAAKTQLKTVIQLRGAKSGEAQRLLTQLESSLWFIER